MGEIPSEEAFGTVLEQRSAKRRVFYGRDNLLVHSSLAIGVGVVFTFAIADELLHQWQQRKTKTIKTKIESNLVAKQEPVHSADAKSVVRGYDSRELFWEDALIRIQQVRQQIAVDLKKEE